MLNHLHNHFNQTQTENGAPAFASTNSAVLDLFALGGAFRNRSDKDITQIFSKAYAEDKDLALKTIFYLRDIEQGQGERRFFRVCLQYLAKHDPNALITVLPHVASFGRWDDVLCLLDTPVLNDVIALISNQLQVDVGSDQPSLLGKWLPSENASSHKTIHLAGIVRKNLGMSSRDYRKMLSSLRKKIQIVETKLTEKNYQAIDYSKLPSIAGMKYRTAFFTHDEERYKEFLDGLSTGVTTVNAKALYPYSIVEKALKGFSGQNVWNHYGEGPTKEEIQLLDAQWKALPDFIGENAENSIAVVDTSGSMMGTPMNVALSLGIYLAERNKGIYHNHFLTFSNQPEFQKIVGQNIVDKTRNLSDADWRGSTNIEAVFDTILHVALTNKVPQEEMVGKVYIISDMEFNYCVKGANTTVFSNAKQKFENEGYRLPEIVFWNVDARNSHAPVTQNELGVSLVSGFSPSIFKNLLDANGKTPYEMMLEVITSERYQQIVHK